MIHLFSLCMKFHCWCNACKCFFEKSHMLQKADSLMLSHQMRPTYNCCNFGKILGKLQLSLTSPALKNNVSIILRSKKLFLYNLNLKLICLSTSWLQVSRLMTIWRSTNSYWFLITVRWIFLRNRSQQLKNLILKIHNLKWMCLSWG